MMDSTIKTKVSFNNLNGKTANNPISPLRIKNLPQHTRAPKNNSSTTKHQSQSQDEIYKLLNRMRDIETDVGQELPQPVMKFNLTKTI